MTSDYQSGASAMREMAASSVRQTSWPTYGDAERIAANIRALPLPADPASSEGADARTAPVQGYSKRIPWEVHLKAFEGYSREYGSSQSAERLAARGGFGVGEMDLFYPKWREHVEELPRLRVSLATRDAEIAIAHCNLLFLEECCRYSLGLAEDLIGDALTKAVGDKVIAMRDEAATLRAALEKIAEHPATVKGEENFGVGWAFSQVQKIAGAALNLKAPTP